MDETNIQEFDRHPETSRLVDAFSKLQVGEKITYDDISERCGVAVPSIKKRVQTARKIALHEHNIIVLTVRGFGFERLAQDDANVPMRSYLAGARSKAKKAGKVAKHGITDWNQIERSKKNELFVTQAAAAAIVQVTSISACKKLAAAVETSNTKLDFGKTLELLK